MPIDISALLQSAAGAAGAPAGPGAPVAPGPAMPTPPTPGAPGVPGAPVDSTAQMALSALDKLAPRDASGQLSLERVGKALDLAQRLIVSALPQISQWNAKMAKDLHVIGRQLADARINLNKEEEPGAPPEALLMGMGNTGIPGGSRGF